MQKIAIFADVQNIYYTVKEKFNCHFNYNTFYNEIANGNKIIKAIAYAIDKNNDKQIHFQEILKKIGFQIKLKPFIQRRDGSTKGDWDTGIVIDMLEYSKDVDKIVLVSGDGDFTEVVQKIIESTNIEVQVYGVPGLTSALLINTATLFIPINGDLLLPIPHTW